MPRLATRLLNLSPYIASQSRSKYFGALAGRRPGPQSPSDEELPSRHEQRFMPMRMFSPIRGNQGPLVPGMSWCLVQRGQHAQIIRHGRTHMSLELVGRGNQFLGRRPYRLDDHAVFFVDSRASPKRKFYVVLVEVDDAISRYQLQAYSRPRGNNNRCCGSHRAFFSIHSSSTRRAGIEKKGC